MTIFINDRLLIDGGEWVPETTTEVDSNLSNLLHCLLCLNFHLEPVVMFSSVGIKQLLENINDFGMAAEYSFFSPVQQLRVLLQTLDAKDWNNDRRQRGDHIYYYVSNGGATTHSVNDSSIAEAAEYSYQHENVLVLNINSSQFNQPNPLHVMRSSINPPQNIEMCSVRVGTSKADLIDYIKAHRLAKVYNWNKKHGQYGKGMIPNGNEVVSPLLGGIEEAATLLKSAVEFRGSSELYAYDEARAKFMVFKPDNTQINSYHSYHPINQNEISNEVKQFINENYALLIKDV